MDIELGTNVTEIDSENLVKFNDIVGGFRVSWSGTTKGTVQTYANHKIAVVPVISGNYYLYTVKPVRNTVVNLVSFTNEIPVTNNPPPETIVKDIPQLKTDDPNVTFFRAPAGARYAILNVATASQSWEFTTLLQELTSEHLYIKSMDGITIDIPKTMSTIWTNSNQSIEGWNIFYGSQNVLRNYYVKTTTSTREFLTATSCAVLPIEKGATYLMSTGVRDYTRDVAPTLFKETADAIFKNTETSLPSLGKADVTLLYDETGVEWAKFTVPQNSEANTVLINVGLAIFNVEGYLKVIKERDTFEYVNKVTEVSDASLFMRPLVKNKFPNLNGKSWCAIGDSITEANFRSLQRYHDYIGYACEGLKVSNFGKSGSGYVSRRTLDGVYDHILWDYVTVFLGTNDWGGIGEAKGKPLGRFMDNTTNTVAGCMRIFFENLVNKFYRSKIGVISPLPRSASFGRNPLKNEQGYTLYDLVQMIKQYCDFFSIPFLDMFDHSNLYVQTSKGNALYFTAPSGTTGDGLHPNDLGHFKIHERIGNFLNSL